MKNIDDRMTIGIAADDPLYDGFMTVVIIGIGYEPVVYLCKVIDCVGSKEFKRDEEITINAYTGALLVNGNREKKDGLLVNAKLGLRTGQWCLI